MADKYQNLLLEWCDALSASQIKEEENAYYGGFRCESCGFPHGRADNAVYPFVYAYTLTNDHKYLDGARALLSFRKKLTKESGALQNDFTSGWEGITAFSAIGLLKTILYFGDKLPLDLKSEIEECAKSAAHWVHTHMGIGYPAYINYYCAASFVNALYDACYHDDDYRQRASELLQYCLKLFTPNGLLAGEGKPHDDKSPKGCFPIDLGYIAEESLPCLLHAAELLGDESAFSSLTEHARKLLDFLLPDGGWDNSFGVRNNKWTYYGSRTSDGCIGAFTVLAKKDELFREAAERTFRLLEKCTHHGKLYGGVQYEENGQKPCIHHTFCHASALTDAILAGISEPKAARTLPSEAEDISYKYYPELNTYKIRAGGYLATLTGYDYATHHFSNGAAHASGGTLSLLYRVGRGPVIAGSVYEYKPTEPNNMQLPTGEKRHATLLVRAEYEKEGVKYATCLDDDPEITLHAEKGAVTVLVRARFLSTARETENESLRAEFHYRFAPDGVTITVKRIDDSIRFLLPIVEGMGEIVTANHYTKEPIFFLTGGFSADEYAFSLGEEVTLKII